MGIGEPHQGPCLSSLRVTARKSWASKEQMCTPCSCPWDLPTLIRSNWVHTTSLPREIWRVGKARGNLQRLSTRGQSRLQDCKLNRVAVHAVWLIVVSMVLHTEKRLVTGRAATLPGFFLSLLSIAEISVRNHYYYIIHRAFPSCMRTFFFFFAAPAQSWKRPAWSNRSRGHAGPGVGMANPGTSRV